VGSFKLALHHLKKLYGHTRAAEFGPLALETVRQSMTEAGWCRTYVNRQTGRIKQVFKWGVARQTVPANVYAALRALEGLKVGRVMIRPMGT
jgi:hypothetical protein